MQSPSKFVKNRVEKEGVDLTIEILEKMVTLIGAGMGLVVALAWNAAIQAFFEKFFPKPTANLIAQFIYAAVITIIVVLVTVYLSRLLQKAKKLKEESVHEEGKS